MAFATRIIARSTWPFAFVLCVVSCACSDNVVNTPTGVTASGSSAGGGGDAGVGGAAGAAGVAGGDAGSQPLGAGSILGRSDTYATYGESMASASFWYGEISSSCAVTVDGSCTAALCSLGTGGGAGGPSQAPNAGEIVFSGGARYVKLTPEIDGTYQPDTSISQPLFGAGETISISATGGEVGAFSEQLLAPTPIIVTSPDLSGSGSITLDTASDLSVSWSGGSQGEVNVLVFAADANTQRSIICARAASSGAHVIPSGLLGELLPYNTGSLWVEHDHDSVVNAGEFEVYLTLRTSADSASSPTGKATATVVFE